MGAIGAIMYGWNNQCPQPILRDWTHWRIYAIRRLAAASLPRLCESEAEYHKNVHFKKNGQENYRYILGLDIGSLSTNVVLIDKDHRVVSRRYLPTAGKPLDHTERIERDF